RDGLSMPDRNAAPANCRGPEADIQRVIRSSFAFVCETRRNQRAHRRGCAAIGHILALLDACRFSIGVSPAHTKLVGAAGSSLRTGSDTAKEPARRLGASGPVL